MLHAISDINGAGESSELQSSRRPWSGALSRGCSAAYSVGGYWNWHGEFCRWHSHQTDRIPKQSHHQVVGCWMPPYAVKRIEETWTSICGRLWILYDTVFFLNSLHILFRFRQNLIRIVDLLDWSLAQHKFVQLHIHPQVLLLPGEMACLPAGCWVWTPSAAATYFHPYRISCTSAFHAASATGPKLLRWGSRRSFFWSTARSQIWFVWPIRPVCHHSFHNYSQLLSCHLIMSHWRVPLRTLGKMILTPWLRSIEKASWCLQSFYANLRSGGPGVFSKILWQVNINQHDS